MGTTSQWLKQYLTTTGRQSGNVVKATWHLGFTAFGGPPVHFKILHDKFVDKLGWLDEQTYQELFALSQALTGPASTKMLYCILLIREGFLPAVLGFAIWSLPGALGMLGLSIGVSNINETLPRVVYALLSGLNASAVGIIALAATQLSQKAITDKLTRILVFFGGAAGILYNALWYFPVLIAVAGAAAIIHDFRWLHGFVKAVFGVFTRRRRRGDQENQSIESQNSVEIGGDRASNRNRDARSQGAYQHENRVTIGASIRPHSPSQAGEQSSSGVLSERDEPRVTPPERRLKMSWKAGLLVIGFFFVLLIVIATLRGVSAVKSMLFRLFSNLFIAGTIIFGGGPVVIPLLRDYVVAEGWVTPRDFLIGLAVIQAFPGPNFNFAVYLGGLTAIKFGHSSVLGALLGYAGIFAPGLILCHGTMGIWGVIRSLRVVKSALRGFSAAGVGLVYTAVYRLWQVGYIDVDFVSGTSLGNEPFWLVVTATSYAGGAWFGLNAPTCIILGAILGLIRYGVVS
ncbi:chromate transporter-domain-containing protein [Xylariaceae sp. FL1651]|nr:chromate transporter-domain-containing protein [Xylariaceae sp. FL1651]